MTNKYACPITQMVPYSAKSEVSYNITYQYLKESPLSALLVILTVS